MIVRSELRTLRLTLGQFRSWLGTVELGKEVTLAGVNFIPTKIGDGFVAGNAFGFDFDTIKIKALGYDVVATLERADGDGTR